MSSKKKIFYYLLLLIGIAAIMDTLVLLSYTNTNFGTLLPAAVGGVFILYAFIKLRIRTGLPIIRNVFFRRFICTVLILGIISVIAVEGLILYNSNSQENIKTDYLVILGAGVKGKTVSLTLKERLDKGIEYLKKYSDAKAIVSGGQGPQEDISEAEAMERYLTANGINKDRVIKEDKSTSTMDNFRFSKQIINSTGQFNQKITIITNDFHMLRAKMLARRNGFEPYGISCGTPPEVILNSFAREYFALIKSFILDR